MSLLLTLESSEANIYQLIDIILHVIYNRQAKEKTPGESRYSREVYIYRSIKILVDDHAGLELTSTFSND